MAPVAASKHAVTRDRTSLRMAEAIHDAFGDLSSEQGLTRAELAAACSVVASAEEFDSRFDIFVSLRLLERVRDKANDGRYVFNPTSGAALLVFERLEEAGGRRTRSERMRPRSSTGRSARTNARRVTS